MTRRLPAILKVLGMVVFVFGLSMLLPLSVSLLLGDDAQMAYDEAILITVGAGGLVWLATHRHRQELKARDGYLLVVRSGRCCRPSRPCPCSSTCPSCPSPTPISRPCPG